MAGQPVEIEMNKILGILLTVAVTLCVGLSIALMCEAKQYRTDARRDRAEAAETLRKLPNVIECRVDCPCLATGGCKCCVCGESK